jgi:hypothetical protein
VHFLELPAATDHHPSADGIIPPVLNGRLPGITKTFPCAKWRNLVIIFSCPT